MAAINNFYSDSENSVTKTSMIMSKDHARVFMDMVNHQPTHSTKKWRAFDIRTGSEVYYIFKND